MNRSETSAELARRCFASALRCLDFLEEDDTDLARETLEYVADDLEELASRLERNEGAA